MYCKSEIAGIAKISRLDFVPTIANFDKTAYVMSLKRIQPCNDLTANRAICRMRLEIKRLKPHTNNSELGCTNNSKCKNYQQPHCYFREEPKVSAPSIYIDANI